MFMSIFRIKYRMMLIHYAIQHIDYIYLLFELCFCRYLKYLGYEVVYVRNFTDIDDKVRFYLPMVSSYIAID